MKTLYEFGEQPELGKVPDEMNAQVFARNASVSRAARSHTLVGVAGYRMLVGWRLFGPSSV